MILKVLRAWRDCVREDFADDPPLGIFELFATLFAVLAGAALIGLALGGLHSLPWIWRFAILAGVWLAYRLGRWLLVGGGAAQTKP